MSHEIRTPMNGILGFSELLKTPGITGAKQHEYIDIIGKSGRRMLNIIDDIVDISKIEAGLMHTEMRVANINEQIEYIHSLIKPETEAKGIKLSFKNGLDSEEAAIRTDQEKLFTILANLVKNALKYTEKGTIEFGYSLIGSKAKSKELLFYVKDTGRGIPKDRQEAIFERFIQADIRDKMARQGAGLGLTIAKSYVEMLGGKIWVESEEDMGSVFYFTLPYDADRVIRNGGPSEEELNQGKAGVQGLIILIAEDDETSGKLISINVRGYSKEVIRAGTGSEAVEICRSRPDIDLILMDIKMPGLNGYEATRQIRQFNKEVVIIAQTAYGLSGTGNRPLKPDATIILQNPSTKPCYFH